MSDPKAKFKKNVGAESGGGRPEGKGYITELQRQKLKPAHLEVIVTKNKERNHYPKRVSNEKWVEVKAELKRKQYQTKQAVIRPQKVLGSKPTDPQFSFFICFTFSLSPVPFFSPPIVFSYFKPKK